MEFKKWLNQESYGSNGGLTPPKQAPSGLTPNDIRKGLGSSLGVSKSPIQDADPPINSLSPTRKNSKYVKEREKTVI